MTRVTLATSEADARAAATIINLDGPVRATIQRLRGGRLWSVDVLGGADHARRAREMLEPAPTRFEVVA